MTCYGKKKVLDTEVGFLGYAMPPLDQSLRTDPTDRYIFLTITMIATYSFYTVVIKEELTGRNTFTLGLHYGSENHKHPKYSQSCLFSTLREHLQRLLR